MIFISNILPNFLELIWRILLLSFIVILPFVAIWSVILWYKLSNRERLITSIVRDSNIKFKVRPHWTYILPKLSIYEILQIHKIISNLWDYFSIRIFMTDNALFIIKGLVKPQIREIPLQNIVNITVTLSMLFGSKCGNIHIFHGEKTKLFSIANPLEFKEILMKKNTSKTTPPNYESSTKVIFMD